MFNFNSTVLVFLILILLSCQDEKTSTQNTPTYKVQKQELKLFYDYPADNWMEEALPIGNAYMGAMFFGGIEEERFQFNEESLWAGGRGEWDEYNGGNRSGAYEYLPKVRALLQEGDYEAAHQLANQELTGIIRENKGNSIWEGFGAYQSFADIFVAPSHGKVVENYRRELNIAKGIGTVSYQIGDIDYKREYFASYPKRAIVLRFSSNNPNGTDYSVRQASLHQNVKFSFEEDQLVMRGILENNGMEFESRMFVEVEGGEVSFENESLKVTGAKSITLYLTGATDYLNFYPTYKGRDYEELNKRTITTVKRSDYQTILDEHIADFSALFDRVSLNLGNINMDTVSTDKRLIAYREGNEDLGLEALYFQYGRYLLISSSRPGSLPANLQGKWNDKNNPPWASDYHANINIQMIYWPAEITNLSDCHEPLIDFVDKLRAPGRQTAKDFFNAEGWIVNTMNNTFGYTAPGWDFPWGFFPGGAGWYAQHVWQHYTFNPDRVYLEEVAYPIMREATLFWLDYLTKDENGHLVSSPSYSPEHGGISTGAYMDIQIVWDLFSNTIEAGEILGVNHGFNEKLIASKEALLPLKIGKWGQLQEWKEDVDDPENKHRHVSHLFALHPGKQISPIQTPELAEAAKISLNARGDEGTGWSIAWKINFWARLLDGNRAYKLLRRALKMTSETGVNMMDGGGVYANMLSTHPPFQLDGNMGTTSGMAEMLLQSHAGVIHLLPALPDAWKSGEIKGLKARGGFEISARWENGKLISASIYSEKGGECKVKYGEEVKDFSLKSGETASW